MSLALLGCQTPSPVAQSPQVPNGMRVDQIVENSSAGGTITQQRTFDQCKSSSPFKSQIRFSALSSEQAQQDLILSARASGEVGISGTAKAALEAAVQRHYQNSIQRSQAYEEGVTIEVPPFTKQEYTLVWRDNRRLGTVYYTDDGVVHTAQYNYRLGVELADHKSQDLPCPGAALAPPNPPPPPSPTLTPGPLPTPGLPAPAPQPLWNEQSHREPVAGTQVVRDLAAGETLYLTGGQFLLNRVYCGGDARQICVLVFEATRPQRVIIDQMVGQNNYIARTSVFGYDELIAMHTDAFWQEPNCRSGCQYASIHHMRDGQPLGGPVRLSRP